MVSRPNKLLMESKDMSKHTNETKANKMNTQYDNTNDFKDHAHSIDITEVNDCNMVREWLKKSKNIKKR